MLLVSSSVFLFFIQEHCGAGGWAASLYSWQVAEPGLSGLAPGLLLSTDCEGAGKGSALPASQHLRAEEEQGPGAAGSLVSGLQAFSLKRPKLERGEDDSFFCDQRESQLQILLSFFTSPGARVGLSWPHSYSLLPL